MWIKTQDGKKIIEVNAVELNKVFGGKYKYGIIGRIYNRGFFSIDVVELGKYFSFEDAKRELDEIENFIAENKKIYCMK
ncbi:hypothetical protein [Clostridium baratii]|uniref:hypothetical protein n=1 Tax=Clostridium baratii TaxID=1561 RepID=UPI0030D5D212